MAKGVVVPRPRRPVEEFQMNCVPFALPKRTVEEAERPFVSNRSVEGGVGAVPKEGVAVGFDKCDC